MATFSLSKTTKISRIIDQAEIALKETKKITIIGEDLASVKAVTLAEQLKSKFPSITQINKTYLNGNYSVLEIELKLIEN
ncbi:unnamed protein product [Blepharisma stoltei]|uniref:DNA/RNA-binding protein Alba-like domain-containing protein n=1 Tax=Blepharisma stoltei TaxID=1481888 RepID=A0AAU9IGC3_9CILI|nr:unnamed protein product [Blepharisma stoltei]